MRQRTFEEIYAGLSGLDSVDGLSRKFKVPRDVVEVILIQKVIRDTKKNYRRVKSRGRELLSSWEEGSSFLKLALREGFPPVMLASILLAEKGFPRGKVRSFFRNPHLCRDKRIVRELVATLESDLVYSPEGSREQATRGKNVEDKISKWLVGRGVSFKTEDEARKEGSKKTPDFLLDKPFKTLGGKVMWVESKATFGDKVEVGADYRKQLCHYVDLFGPGVVVYWYGFLGDLSLDSVFLWSRANIKAGV